MIYRALVGFFCFFTFTAEAQVLRDLNYNYQYNPDEPFSLNWKVVRQAENYLVFYELTRSDSTQKNGNISVQWETRNSIGGKNGDAIASAPEIVKATPGKTIATIKFTAPDDQKVIVAQVTVMTDQKKPSVYLFHKKLPQKNSLFLSTNQLLMTSSFIRTNSPALFSGFNAAKPIQISYYNDPFPAAAPAFSSAQAKVSKTLKPDSLFSIEAGVPTPFNKKGLYLAQQDTSSAEGIAFRVEEDYPKFGKIESLAGPLIYICTKQEAEKLKLSGNDKKKFDQVILTITGNSERARTFMRSYFRRVELANQNFSSYKEGWKTDRGMIYIIFGLPEEVYLFDDREVWDYKNDTVKVRFQFVKSPTLFDPDNYVLIRDKKFTNTWYEMVDLWRKARF